MSEPLIHRDDLAQWCRVVLAQIDGLPDDKVVPGYWGERDEPLTVADLRERTRALLTKLVVDGAAP